MSNGIAGNRYVVIVGAGASSRLGHDDQGLPLMAGWAAALCEKLNAREPDANCPGLAGALGLSPNMSGPEFETRLGTWTTHFRTFDLYGLTGLAASAPGYPADSEAEIGVALARARGRLSALVEETTNTMYEQFRAGRIDGGRANEAYGRLLETLGATPGMVVFATTNYDVAIEMGLHTLEWSPFDGFRETPDRWGRIELDPKGTAGNAPAIGTNREMVDWPSRHHGRTPVIHLHGAVGWYDFRDHVFREDATYFHDPGKGAALFLPPDPDKDPMQLIPIRSLWEQFFKALDGCTHVLVLGHSLNDRPIVEAIREHAYHAQIAITHHGPDSLPYDTYGPGRDERFPASDVWKLPIDFGPTVALGPPYRAWVEYSRASI